LELEGISDLLAVSLSASFSHAELLSSSARAPKPAANALLRHIHPPLNDFSFLAAAGPILRQFSCHRALVACGASPILVLGAVFAAVGCGMRSAFGRDSAKRRLSRQLFLSAIE
jgi:hypothetical protein